jgi:HEAT repeat protein
MDFKEIDSYISSADSSDRRNAASMLTDIGGDDAVERLVALLQDTNGGVRDAAQNALTFIGGKHAIKKLVPLLKMTNVGIRNAAIDILRNIGDEGLEILNNASRHDADVRLFVLDILGTIGNPESLDILIEGLKDKDANIRNAAVISLGMLGDAKAFEHLKSMIDDEEWIRFSAIEALARIPHDEAVDFLMDQLARWSHDELTLSAILETLGKLQDKRCVGALIKLIENTNEYIETSIVQTLLKILTPEEIASLPKTDAHIIKSILDRHIADTGDELHTDMLLVLSHIGDRDTVLIMIELARKTDPDAEAEQWSAITDALIRIGDTEPIIELLDREDKLKILASNIIAQSGHKQGIQEICSRIFSFDGHVKRAMTDALVSIGDTSFRDIFLRLIKDKDGHVISSSLQALGEMGNPEDIPEIEPYLVHPYPDVRETALNTIVRIGTSRAEEVFNSMISDDDPTKRIAGLRGLSQLKSVYLDKECDTLLKDGNQEVRAAAVKAIRDEGLMIDVEMLKTLLTDKHEQIRYMALDIVGIKKIDELRPFLEDAVTSDDIWTASHAIEALSIFRDEQGKFRLLSILENASDFLRISAAKSLGRWDDMSLIDNLEPFLDDPNPDVARAVLEALDRLQGVSF